jgi:hypothetical protein
MRGMVHILLLRRFCCKGSQDNGFRGVLEYWVLLMLGEDML